MHTTRDHDARRLGWARRVVAAALGVGGVGAAVLCASVPGASPAGAAGSTSGSGAPSIVAAPVKVVSTPDGTVAYREIGKGNPTIVLIMGYSGSMDDWDPPFVDTLARSHRVVIFDNAGIGKTSPLAGTLTISGMGQQTAALISALHLGKADVLGWSMGGMIAQALAVEHPSDVSHLVLAATLPGNGKATIPTGPDVSALENVSAANATALLAVLFPASHKATATTYIHNITTYPDFALAPTAVDKEQFSAITTWSTGKTAVGAGIAHLRLPVLVADGRTDVLIPTANDTEMAKVIPHAQLVLYPDASHGFLIQDSRAFLARLAKFWG